MTSRAIVPYRYSCCVLFQMFEEGAGPVLFTSLNSVAAASVIDTLKADLERCKLFHITYFA